MGHFLSQRGGGVNSKELLSQRTGVASLPFMDIEIVALNKAEQTAADVWLTESCTPKTCLKFCVSVLHLTVKY